jgi:ketosteroid isomerase-like protein
MRPSVFWFLIVFSCFTAFQPAHSADAPADAAKLAKNKETARIWYDDIVVKKDYSQIDKILADDVVEELAPAFPSPKFGTNKVMGKENTKEHIIGYLKANTVAIDGPVTVVAEGNKVVAFRQTINTRADGARGVTPWFTLFEFDDNGRITHMTHVHDTLHLQRQYEASKPK